jgi:hypothetical protein
VSISTALTFYSLKGLAMSISRSAYVTAPCVLAQKAANAELEACSAFSSSLRCCNASVKSSWCLHACLLMVLVACQLRSPCHPSTYVFRCFSFPDCGLGQVWQAADLRASKTSRNQQLPCLQQPRMHAVCTLLSSYAGVFLRTASR